MTVFRLGSVLALCTSALSLAACGGGDPYIDGGDTTGPDEQITVTGMVSQGRRCPLLTADDGTVYALAGGGGVSAGRRYEIHGLAVEDSVCLDGDAAISVSTVEEDFAPGTAPGRD